MSLFNFLFSFILACILISFPVEAEEKWKEHKSRHFVIYYQNAPVSFIEQVEKAAERDYGEISDGLGVRRIKTWSLDNRAEIYIYDDNEHYVASGSVYNWSHGSASPEDKAIRSFPAAHGFFDSTLPHELAHIIFRELIGYEARVPLWLEEGVAMYYEKGQRFGAHRAVKESMEDESFIPLDQLSSTVLKQKGSEEKVHQFYQQAASIVNFMIEEMGTHKFKMFCKKLERDKDFNEALHSVYTRQKDIQGLNKAWVDFLRTQ